MMNYQDILQQILTNFATSNTFVSQMSEVFGENNQFTFLQEQWLHQTWTLPTLEIISSSEINGARGAYASRIDTIYLSQELLDTNDLNLITRVLLEEYGHHLDAVINLSDTVGDEGELFARIVLGEILSPEDLARIQAEDDVAVVKLDGQIITVEMSTPNDLGGNTFATATDIGTLDTTPTIINDFVGIIDSLNVDRNDYYQFTISEDSQVELKLGGLSADATLYLRNSSNQILQTSNTAGNVDEFISNNLRAGNYYIQVSNGNQGTTYRLEASATALAPVPFDGGGNTLATATDIGTLTTTPTIINDFVGIINPLDSDTNDYYSFIIT